MWQFNNTFLNNQQIREVITREIRKQFETNEKNTMYQNLQEYQKQQSEVCVCGEGSSSSKHLH